MRARLKYSGKIDQVAAVWATRERPLPDVKNALISPDQYIYVRGWAFGPGSSFAIVLDRGRRISFATGLSRPDVARAVGSPDAASAGFELFIEGRALVNGLHRLALVAVEGKRIETLDGVTVRVADPLPLTTSASRDGGTVFYDRISVGNRDIDPETRAVIVGRDHVVTIEGWAIDGLERREGVALCAVIDEQEALPVSYGHEREDLVKALARTEVRFAGFKATIDPSGYTAGSHIVRMVLVMGDGTARKCADTLAVCLED